MKKIILIFMLILSFTSSGSANMLNLFEQNFDENSWTDSTVYEHSTIIQEKEVEINPDILAIDPGSLDNVKIDLFSNISINVHKEKIEDTNLGSILWMGSIKENPEGKVILAISSEGISGRIIYKNRLFLLRHVDDTQVLREIYQNRSSQRSRALQPSTESLEQDVFVLVNEERASNNLYAYSYNTNLALSARLHSEDMAQNNYFSHTSLDGRSPSERIEAAGYQASYSGENIAAGTYVDTAAEVMEMWMNSSGHRAAILSTYFCEIGVGYAYDSTNRYGHNWTQNFGKQQGVSECSDRPDPLPPQAPGAVVCTPESAQVNISWEASPSSEITQYNIYRGTTSDNMELIYETNSSQLSYTDLETNCETVYYYAVSAENSVGEGPRASADPVTTENCPANTSDVNNDGITNVMDAMVCINVILGVETDADIIARSDVNNDGSVNVQDAMEIINVILQP